MIMSGVLLCHHSENDVYDFETGEIGPLWLGTDPHFKPQAAGAG